MKVLYISNRPFINKQEAFKWFQFYCEKQDDLYLYNTLDSAMVFLKNMVIEKKKHLDFIITDWNFNFQKTSTFLRWLKDSNEIYSADNFLFRSIPILLIEDTTYQSFFISDGFDGVVEDFPDNHRKLRNTVKNAIKTWRYSLATDLDLIGLDPKTQKNYPSHRSNFYSYYKLKVLSRQFVDNKSKRLNYIWTNVEIKPLNDSNDAYQNKMIRTLRNPPKYLEKEFHEFFRANPTFIKGEDFLTTSKDMLYKNTFSKTEQGSMMNLTLLINLTNMHCVFQKCLK